MIFFIYLIKKIWYIDIYIDVYIYELFQFKSILVLVLTYCCLYKDIRQCPQGLTPCSCIICLPKESMLCVCGCSCANYCLLRGWISTCPGTANWYSIKQLSPRLCHWSQHFLLKTSLCGFTTFRKGIAQTYTMS